MNQQPDKIFNDKLKSYQRPAPAPAWNRIESQLDKKNNKGFYLRIAATLLFLAVATGLLIFKNKNLNTDQLATVESVKEKIDNNQLSKKHKVEQKVKEQTQQITNDPSPVEKSTKKTSEANRVIKKQKSAQSGVTQATNGLAHVENAARHETHEEKEEVAPNLIDTKVENIVAVISQQETRTAITLVYSANEVDSKYLNKKSLTDATEEEKKPSTLKKLLDKAYELKHNQDPFGELRQKKNEILALNFKNEKQRSQNR